ncbi:MAG: tRNA pseudouridine(55) synthase TruB [Endomicrobium sp.]|jgi:tRNA pseudouridine55 synthase|nr:tRNA pseudouridine(55) synthase TruB [Endomicrobium sp.]
MAKIYNDISGMLLLDKPSGITSFKVVHKIKKMLKVKKVGHCGTLDPAATGLLIVLVGKATKIQDKFMKKDKVYISSFLLGTVTNTGDLEGNIVYQKYFLDILDIDIKKIKNAAKNFTGELYQVPPMYSALKHKGKKLYEFARRGIEVERKSKKIVINEFEVISYFNDIVNVRVSCSSGTYIRALAQDFGNFLGCGATVKTLRREYIDTFDVKNALKYEDCDDVNKIIENMISLDIYK